MKLYQWRLTFQIFLGQHNQMDSVTKKMDCCYTWIVQKEIIGTLNKGCFVIVTS